MDFKVGDTAFYDWVGKADEVEIIKCYPKSDRYRIRVRGTKSFELNAKESEVFRTENALWQSKLDKINSKIEALEKTREEYRGKGVESHTLNE